jgi:ABC-type Na+ efflux pump permease subunit
VKNSFVIALNDLRVFFSDRSNWFNLLGLPVILTVLLGAALQDNDGIPRFAVDVIDEDGTPQSAQLIADLRAASSSIYLCPFDDGPNSPCNLPSEPLTRLVSRERVRTRTSGAMVVIPTGFGTALQTAQPVQLQYASLTTIGSIDPISEALNVVVQRYNVALAAQVVALQTLDALPRSADFFPPTARAEFAQRAAQRADALQQANPMTFGFTLGGEPQAVGGVQQGFGQSIPGMGSMFVMFTVFTGIALLIRERRQWTLQRLVMAPLPRAHILAGKVLFLLILGLVQYTAVFAIAAFTGTSLGRDPLALGLTMIAFVFCITALTLLLSTVIKTEAQASSVTLLLAMTLAPLGGAWWPLDVVPDFMRTLGYLSPVAWAMNSYRSLIFENGSLITVLPALGVLVAVGLVFFLLGVRRFSYE